MAAASRVWLGSALVLMDLKGVKLACRRSLILCLLSLSLSAFQINNNSRMRVGFGTAIKMPFGTALPHIEVPRFMSPGYFLSNFLLMHTPGGRRGWIRYLDPGLAW